MFYTCTNADFYYIAVILLAILFVVIVANIKEKPGSIGKIRIVRRFCRKDKIKCINLTTVNSDHNVSYCIEIEITIHPRNT